MIVPVYINGKLFELTHNQFLTYRTILEYAGYDPDRKDIKIVYNKFVEYSRPVWGTLPYGTLGGIVVLSGNKLAIAVTEASSRVTD